MMMKRFTALLGMLLLVTALVAVVFTQLHAVHPAQQPVCAIWVTRFDYTTPADVHRIVHNVAAAGFTDLFFQVRGNGTTFYPSALEPRAYELSGESVDGLGTDPGWDPLQTAIDDAREAKLRIHAYINVLPGWKGRADPPAAAEQLWTKHPEWFMVDSTGTKMRPTDGWYAFINPVLQEVRQHLREIVTELCRYDVDGIHLDYIRYPYDYHLVADQHYPEATKEELMRHSDFSYDDASQAALFNRYGWDVTKQEITQFRCDSITRVVRDLSYVTQVEKPGLLLTAAVLANPVEGRVYAYQDSGMWAKAGLVDWVVQMNYGTKSFLPNLERMNRAVGTRRFRRSAVVGINGRNEVPEILKQLDAIEDSSARGFAFFAYAHLFDEQHAMTEKGRILLPEIQRRN